MGTGLRPAAPKQHPVIPKTRPQPIDCGRINDQRWRRPPSFEGRESPPSRDPPPELRPSARPPPRSWGGACLVRSTSRRGGLASAAGARSAERGASRARSSRAGRASTSRRMSRGSPAERSSVRSSGRARRASTGLPCTRLALSTNRRCAVPVGSSAPGDSITLRAGVAIAGSRTEVIGGL